MTVGTAVLSNVEQLALQLSRREQLLLLERLAHNVRAEGPPHAHDLYGVWSGRIPADVDLDQILDRVRAAWQDESE